MVYDILYSLVSKSGKTQKDIAVELGISRQRFNFYVTGKRAPDLETLRILASYFGVTTDYLLGHDAKKESPSEDELSQLVLQDDVMKDIYDAVVDLSPENRRIILAQIRAVQRLEADAKK